MNSLAVIPIPRLKGIENIDAPLSGEARATITDGYLKVVVYLIVVNGKHEASLKQIIVYVDLDADDTWHRFPG